MSPKQARRINEITPSEALVRCIEHREIFHDEMLHLMRMLMRGEMSPVMASALLMGLRVKKETVGEIAAAASVRSEEHTSELQSRGHLVCRLLLEKKKYKRV